MTIIRVRIVITSGERDRGTSGVLAKPTPTIYLKGLGKSINRGPHTNMPQYLKDMKQAYKLLNKICSIFLS